MLIYRCFLLDVFFVPQFICDKNGLINGLFLKLIYLGLRRELRCNLMAAVLGLMTFSVVIGYDVSEVPAAPVFKKSDFQATRCYIPNDSKIVTVLIGLNLRYILY
jgi:hypothetical protein